MLAGYITYIGSLLPLFMLLDSIFGVKGLGLSVIIGLSLVFLRGAYYYAKEI